MITGLNTKKNTYAFGMPMPGRSYQISNGYRYGMNGQEKDLEIAEGIYTAMYWEYDSRLGRRWNMDPKPTATESSYSCFSNSPILKNDVNGDTTHIYTTAGVYKGTILDKLKTNEVVLMTESQANSVLGLQGGKYSEEIVAIVARDPKIASARMTENTVKELTKFSTSSPQENSGLMYADKVTKEVKLDKAKNKPSDHPIIGGEADPQELGALEKSTSSKGNIIGYFHTHPENTLFGSQPSESDFTGGGYVDALQNGGIGAIVTKGKVGLFPLTNMGTGITPQVKDRKPNGSLFPTSNHNAVFNKKVSPQYIKK